MLPAIFSEADLTGWATVGLGATTVVLAGITLFVARVTRRSVTEAQRPVVVPFDGWVDEKGVWHEQATDFEFDSIWVPVRNVGTGPGLNVTARLRLDEGDWFDAKPVGAIALYERAVLEIDTFSGPNEPRPYAIEIWAEDVAGLLYETSAVYRPDYQRHQHIQTHRHRHRPPPIAPATGPSSATRRLPDEATVTRWLRERRSRRD
jgi:hypothetical protein